MTAYVTTAELRQYLAQVPEYAQQRVTLATAAPFTLTYEAQTTSSLAATAAATAVQTALTGLTTIGSGKAKVSGPAGGPWTVTLTAGNDASPITGTNVTIEPATDDLLAAILDRATAIVDKALGFSFAGYAATATERIIYAEKSKWLRLPPYEAGSITALVNDERTQTYTSDDYDLDADDYRYLYNDDAWTQKRYRVTAKWGYGLPPTVLVEVTIEIAVNLWRSKDRGLFTDVIGVDASGGAVVGYQGALTNQQKMIVERIRDEYRERVF